MTPAMAVSAALRTPSSFWSRNTEPAMLEPTTSAKSLPGELATWPPPFFSSTMLAMTLGVVATAVAVPAVPPPPPETEPAVVMPLLVPLGWVGSVTV